MLSLVYSICYGYFSNENSFCVGRLFTVLHFSVRTSRSSALRDGLPSCMSVKTTQGAGAVWEEARKIEGL